MIDPALETELECVAHELPVLPESLRDQVLLAAQQQQQRRQQHRRWFTSATTLSAVCLLALCLRLTPAPAQQHTPLEQSNPYTSILGMSSPQLEWAHVESTARLKQKSLQSLRNAF